MARKKVEDGPTFEEALVRLEEIVEKLEHGELKLDEAIELFRQGVDLSGTCNKKLLAVQQEVEKIIIDSRGEVSLQPLYPAEE